MSKDKQGKEREKWTCDKCGNILFYAFEGETLYRGGSTLFCLLVCSKCGEEKEIVE